MFKVGGSHHRAWLSGGGGPALDRSTFFVNITRLEGLHELGQSAAVIQLLTSQDIRCTGLSIDPTPSTVLVLGRVYPSGRVVTIDVMRMLRSFINGWMQLRFMPRDTMESHLESHIM